MCIQTLPRRSKGSSKRSKRPLSVVHPETTTPITTKQQQQNHQQQQQQQQQQHSEETIHRIRSCPRRKSVSFNKVVIVRPVLHLNDFTDQEVSDCWYARADIKRIKSEIMGTLRKCKDGKFEGCTRGLENHLHKGVRRKRRKSAIARVLKEQDHQIAQARRAAAEHSGDVDSFHDSMVIYDSEKFREVLRKHSRVSRHKAQAMGKIDELSTTVAGKKMDLLTAVQTTSPRCVKRRFKADKKKGSSKENSNVPLTIMFPMFE